ncbi:hypothetical protein SDC9_135578 [bioreactor metagenome]|uniref:SGNH hydrolase-type esterase domain-containing protein n=1 Tax=bioreactor metagenome TaxID=1076179 RepID=A0A645DG84_9ZZZZ
MGLHDIYLPDEKTCAVSPEEYRENLDFIAGFLHKKFPQAKIFFALTTPVNEESQKSSPTYGRLVRRNTDVQKYNEIAREVMKAHGATVVDLHSFVTRDMIQADGIHLNKEAQQTVGTHVAEILKGALSSKSATE